MKPSYAAIEAVAKKLGYPEWWEDDLYCWDRQFIEKNEPTSFAWVIRKYGSHILGIGPELEHPIMLDYAEAVAATFQEGDKRYYIWKGEKLIHCKTADTWLEHIRQAERTRAHPTTRRLYARAAAQTAKAIGSSS